jgi:phosphoglycerol transferase
VKIFKFEIAPPVFLGLFLSMLFLIILIRNFGLYPIVFFDEWYYSYSSRLSSIANARDASFFYLTLYKLSNICGDAFLQCARLFNAILFIAAIPFIYMVATLATSRKNAAFIAAIAALLPINTYTAYFMPESLYFFFFWFITWTLFSLSMNKPYIYGGTVGFLLAVMTMVKPHAFFLIPPLCLFILCRAWDTSRPNWTACASKVIFILIIVALLLRLSIGYSLAGINGLSIFGNRYAGIAQSVFNLSDYISFIGKSALVLSNHITALVIMFFTPILSLFFLKSPGDGQTLSIDNARSLKIYAASILITLIAVTSAFTIAVIGTGPYEVINRVHMRYYNFIFPLFLIIASSEITLNDFNFRSVTFVKVLSSLAAGAVGVYAISHTYSSFSPNFVDCPEIRGLTCNKYIFYFLGSLGIASAVLFNLNRSLGAKLFLYLVMPLSIFTSSLFITVELNHHRAADVYDKSGMFAHQTLAPNELSKLQVVGPEPSGLYKTLFHIDNPQALILELSPEHFDRSKIDKKAEWLLVVGNYPISSLPGLKINLDGYSLVRLTGSNSADFRKGANWPSVLTETTGLSSPESWGTWSDAKEVHLSLPFILPERFKLHLTAQAFKPNVGQPFHLRLGAQERVFTLTDTPQVITLQFDHVEDSETIVITVPRPISPKELGLGSDTRKLGIGLIMLQIEPKL